jgi:hypothetical protein
METVFQFITEGPVAFIVVEKVFDVVPRVALTFLVTELP